MRQMVKNIAKLLPPIERLVKQRETLTAQVHALNQVLGDRDVLAREHHTLASQRDNLARERDSLMHERNNLAQERDNLAQERNNLAGEVKRLQSLIELSSTRPWRGRPLTEAEIAEYRARIEAHKWFHSFNLGYGLVTRGECTADALASRLANLCIPNDLSGLTFLDIAAWDGFYSFEAEQRGAARVLATDSFCWDGPGWGKKAGFLLVREILGSKVEDRHVAPMEICPESVGMFDVVFFSGVLYHMREPLTSLARAASVASKMLIVETAVADDPSPKPYLHYIPRENQNNVSNYWRPNTASVLLWLRENGFSRIEHRVVHEGGPRGFFNAMR